MMRIEPLLEGGNRLWCIEIQKYYVFFYEVRKGRRIIGKNKIKEILFCSMNARDVLFSGFLCVVSWYALNVCVGKNFVYVQGTS